MRTSNYFVKFAESRIGPFVFICLCQNGVDSSGCNLFGLKCFSSTELELGWVWQPLGAWLGFLADMEPCNRVERFPLDATLCLQGEGEPSSYCLPQEGSERQACKFTAAITDTQPNVV